MHQLLAEQYVASIKRRASQGDCPTEAPLSVEALEDLALTLDALSSIPKQGVGADLTAYELQVLIGTSISGCNMSPDRVFNLNAAWARLYGLGLIDRTDGIACPTKLGEARILSALAPSQPAAVGELEVAARDLVASRSESYRAGNNRQVSLQDQDGEKMWIVPFDEMAALEAALVDRDQVKL